MKTRSEVSTSGPMSISPTQAMWAKRPIRVRSPIRRVGVVPATAATTDRKLCSSTVTSSPRKMRSGSVTRAGGTTQVPAPWCP